MTTPALRSRYRIKVGGSYLAEQYVQRVAEVLVELHVHLPSMFVFKFADADNYESSTGEHLAILNGDALTIGQEVEIEVGAPDGNSFVSILTGEITAVDLELEPNEAPMVVVRGYDRGHRLHRGRQTRSFLNQTDSNIVSTVCREAGLQADVQSTSVQHEYVLQYNQTDWEFLRDRAARVGYELFVEGRKLCFKQPESGAPLAATLEYGTALTHLRLHASTAFQVNQVTVRGWDPESKREIVGQATQGGMTPEIGLGRTGGQVSQQAFGRTTNVSIVDWPVANQGEASAIAKSVYDERNGEFIQAEGTCIGNPAIKPRSKIEIQGLGSRYSGRYYVTSATHRIGWQGSYETTFVVSGSQTTTLLEMTRARADRGLPSGVVVGIVTNLEDPKGWGRIKVKFPWLSSTQNQPPESAWARIAAPMTGRERGFYFLPEINDEVLVAFEHDDPNRPYIVGGLWNGQDKPPKANSAVVASGKVKERIIKSTSGHIITIDDTQGSEKISIVDKTGNNLIQIESSSNKISITADGDVAITTQGKTTVNAQQDVDVQTQANVKVKAQGNIQAEATGNASIKATGNVDVEATGNATVKATGQLNMQGNMVTVQSNGMMQIKANGILEIQGSLVKIN